MGISELIDDCLFQRIDQRVLVISQSSDVPYLLYNPTELRVEVEAGVNSSIVLIHDQAIKGEVSLHLAKGATFNVVELFEGKASINFGLFQSEDSHCDILTLQLSDGEVDYKIHLDGQNAENNLNALFMVAEGEHSVLKLRMNHNVADCRSKSFIKGVAGGKATGEFHGLVYVAKDAQHTDAQQQNRNIELTDTSRIIAKPELEIYADDVKCSHGVTMGQIDTEAILYMRQRGLSEAQARMLQTEGFVNDIVARCAIEPLCAILLKRVVDKLEKM